MLHETDRSVFSNHQFPVASPWLGDATAHEESDTAHNAVNFARGLVFALPLSALLWGGIALAWHWLA
jgi:hypothetical protein